MISYTIWSEAGGVGKTTFAVNLATAHARHGQRVLVIDMDPQDGGLTHHVGVDQSRAAADADNLVLHLIDRPRGDFWDLVESVDDRIDVVPGHNMLESLERNLIRAAEIESEARGDPDYEWPKEKQLRRVLVEAGVPDEYDVLVVDPPATTGQHVYNAVYATSNLLIPAELSAKGRQSVGGLRDVVSGIEAELDDVEVGVLAVVPNRVSNTRKQKEYEARLGDQDLPVAPVSIRERRAMLEGAWDNQVSAFEFVEEHRSRTRQREVETLRKFDELARFVAGQFGVDLDAPAGEVEA
jgi:cellulose biosynthesis protein BcsQ